MPIQFTPFPQMRREQVFPEMSGYRDLLGSVGMGQELYKQAMENEIAKWKAKYAPLTIPAEAASKLAYANLVGPQFVAKLMSNPEILANIPDDQKNQLVPYLIQMGMNPTQISNLFQGRPVQNMPTGYTPTMGSQQQTVFAQGPQRSTNQQPTNWLSKEPLQQNLSRPSSMQYQPNQQPEENLTWAEKTARVKGIEEEGAEAGKIRAKDIGEFGDAYDAYLERRTTYNELARMLDNPVFQSIRQVPFAQQQELSYYANVGSPEQQQMVGNFLTAAKKSIQDTMNTWKGKTLARELPLSEQMSIGPKDRYHVIRGKLEAAMIYDEFNGRRADIASDLMEKNHWSKKRALKEADRLLKGDKIRADISNRLHMEPRKEDIKFMMQEYGITEEEVKKRLRKKGYKVD